MLSAALDIRNWLEADRETAHSERMARDRLIGRDLPDSLSAPEKVLAWWNAIEGDDPDSASQGARAERLRGVATVALILVGLVLGGSLAGVAFGYEGDYPVNLFALLGVVVGVPALLLVLTLLMLPGRIPGIRGVQELLAGFSVSHWVELWLDHLSGGRVFADFPGAGSTSRAFSRWQLVVFSQWLAIGFFAGLLLVAWLLVAFTDLAFGWSTTLEIEAASVHRFFAGLASPWAGWLAVAVPDAELVDASRFYRLEEGGMAGARVARLGQWWPFVLMVIVSYGLLPRVLLLGAARWRLGVATRGLLLDNPEVTALLDRLTLPMLDYDGEAEVEQETGGAMLQPPPLTAGVVRGVESSATGVLIWNDALVDEDAGVWLEQRLGIAGCATRNVSVRQSADAQRQVLAELPREMRRLVLFTKGWEPPLLDFVDFLGVVREELGPGVVIVLVPIAVDRDRILGEERAVWAGVLGRRDDPAMYVFAADDEEPSAP